MIVAVTLNTLWITAITMQLLTVAIPKLEQLSKEGDDGRKKIQQLHL